MDMEPQGGGGGIPQQQSQGQQRYCPTPMAPPPSSPVPQTVTSMQHQQHQQSSQQHHQPPPAISPHHPGYFSHHPHHSYPQPQHSYYPSYYPHHQGQPTTPTQHYQHQWGHHHYSYQAQSVSVAVSQSQQQQQHTQATAYPPQAQSPYAYVQHQQQPQQQHLGLSQSSQPGSVPIGQSTSTQQQQQQQPQHALMNLSRFVSQQSPCSSPSPHPHSPTTPVPMGSPHYPPLHNPQGQGHLSQPLHSQSQTQQHHVTTTSTNIHQNSYNSSAAALQSQSHPTALPVKPNAHTNITTISNHPIVNNNISDQVQISSIDISSVLNNLPIGVSNGGRSGSNSPSSGSSSKPLSSPPATPSASSNSNSNTNNGQMIPVRLQNMQKGARTKASMRKLMQEQQNSSGQLGFVQEGFLSSDIDTETESKPEPVSKKSAKSPKKTKKGASLNESLDYNSRTPKESIVVDSSSHLKDMKIPEDPMVLPGYTKKGKKIGRPPKPKLPTDKPTKQKGRKSKKTVVNEMQLETNKVLKSKTPHYSPVKSPVPVLSASEEEPTTASVVTEHSPGAVTEDKSENEEPIPVSQSPKSLKKVSATRKGRRTVTKLPKPQENLELTVSDSEDEEEEEDLNENEVIPVPTTRPIRTRASKEPAKRKETKAPERSRQARAKRASISYKEMSTSRSKSPKEATSTPSPVKKSPPSPVKKSPKNPVPPKTSPRLKEASPSPVRIRQLKEQSPIENRRETRSSKERDETPKRSPRKAKSKGIESESVSTHSDEPPLSPSKRRSPKLPRDTTPIRVSSPRLAKDRSSTPKQSSKTSNQEQESTPKATKSSVKKGKRLMSNAKDEIEKEGKSRKRKNSERDLLKLNSSEESAIEVTEKKPKLQKSTKKRKRRGSKYIEETPTEDIVCNVEDQQLVTSNTDAGTIGGILDEEKSRATRSLQKQKSIIIGDADVSSSTLDTESSAIDSSLEFKSPSGSEVEPIRRRPSLVDARRRSKSPRQSLDMPSSSPPGQYNPNPVVIIPQLPVMNSKVFDNSINTNFIESSSNFPHTVVDDSSPNETVSSTVELISNSDHVAPTPNLKKLSVSKPVVTAESGTPKIKKPRKPRAPKDKLPKVEDIKTDNDFTAKKKTKLEQQIEFQQRKATLEVEVAQALLEMKHSNKSPSPVKSLDSSSVVISSTPVLPGPSKTKKRKSTNSEIAETNETFETLKYVARALSPDVSNSTLPIKNIPLKGDLTGKKKNKKQRQQPEFPQTSTPTILAVPQVNGNQSLNFSCNSTISFQNSPIKVGGPVKVSKTVSIPSGASGKKGAPNIMSDVDSTIASVSSVIMSTTPNEKTPKLKTKKKVVPKTLNPTTIISGSDIRIKRKYTKKKSKTQISNSDNQNQNESIAATKEDVTGNFSESLKPIKIKLTESPDTKLVSKPVENSPKKRRKSPTFKLKKPEPFQLNPKPLPIPTVFVKSPPLATNGPAPGTSSSESKEKPRAGPSLKVIWGRTKFYRGSDQEELNAEPQIPKPRGPTQFDPEVPWLCCFCSLGPHAQKLGDLFGPYFSEQTIGTGKSKSIVKRETWMHQDCALWAGSVVLIGTKLHGLEETLAHSKKDTCTTCGNKGATIGCLKRGCKQAVHYPCAIRKSWKLDEESFHSFCPAHIS